MALQTDVSRAYFLKRRNQQVYLVVMTYIYLFTDRVKRRTWRSRSWLNWFPRMPRLPHRPIYILPQCNTLSSTEKFKDSAKTQRKQFPQGLLYRTKKRRRDDVCGNNTTKTNKTPMTPNIYPVVLPGIDRWPWWISSMSRRARPKRQDVTTHGM